jgi:O-ureido-D-serine cyclo-ligase
MGSRVALLAAQDAMDLDTDGPLLFPALERAGIGFDVVPWDRPTRWSRYDLVIIRATWDYHLRVEEFRSVLDLIESQTTLHNALRAVEWNLDKRYFVELARGGVPMIDSAFVSHLTPPTELGSALARIDRWGCSEVVVKPSVSAGSNDTYRLESDDGSAVAKAVQSIIDSDRVAMLQPYLDSVDTYGERGCVYVDGEFDHSFSKAALLQPGEQRVEGLFAVETVAPAVLSPEERAVADRVSAWLTERFGPLLYARVDLLASEDGPKVIEVELIEPSLFFETDPPSADRFAAAVGGATRRIGSAGRER